MTAPKPPERIWVNVYPDTDDFGVVLCAHDDRVRAVKGSAGDPRATMGVYVLEKPKEARVLHCVKHGLNAWATLPDGKPVSGMLYGIRAERHDFGTPEAAKKFARENWGRYVKVTVKK